MVNSGRRVAAVPKRHVTRRRARARARAQEERHRRAARRRPRTTLVALAAPAAVAATERVRRRAIPLAARLAACHALYRGGVVVGGGAIAGADAAACPLPVAATRAAERRARAEAASVRIAEETNRAPASSVRRPRGRGVRRAPPPRVALPPRKGTRGRLGESRRGRGGDGRDDEAPAAGAPRAARRGRRATRARVENRAVGEVRASWTTSTSTKPLRPEGHHRRRGSPPRARGGAVAHERGGVDDVAARDEGERPRRATPMSWKPRWRADARRRARGARGRARRRTPRTSSRGDGRITIAAGGARCERTRRALFARRRASLPRRGRARDRSARRLFFASWSRVVESISDSCARPALETAGDAACTTCSRDLFAARDADVDAAGSDARSTPYFQGGEGKKDPLLACAAAATEKSLSHPER